MSNHFHVVNQTDAEFANRIASAVSELRRALLNLSHASLCANRQFEQGNGQVNTDSIVIHATAAAEANNELQTLTNLARVVGVPEPVIRVALEQPELEFRLDQ